MIDFVSSSIKLSAWIGAAEALGTKGWSFKTKADIKLVKTTIKARKTKTNPIPKRVKLIDSLNKLLSTIMNSKNQNKLN